MVSKHNLRVFPFVWFPSPGRLRGMGFGKVINVRISSCLFAIRLQSSEEKATGCHWDCFRLSHPPSPISFSFFFDFRKIFPADVQLSLCRLGTLAWTFSALAYGKNLASFLKPPARDHLRVSLL